MIETFLCSHCGRPHPISDRHEMDGSPLCPDCLEDRTVIFSHCGLHVHVNRSSFGETEYEQEPVIARILYFVEKHWEELLKFSRRTPRQLERWASRL